MTDLTEQWKSGELMFGAYYGNRLEEHRIWLYNDRSKTPESQHDIYEILAPVPSYEEWQASETSIAYNELLEENDKLKELLSVCRKMLEEYRFSEGDFTIGDNLEMDTSLLLKMINNTIGEKK